MSGESSLRNVGMLALSNLSVRFTGRGDLLYGCFGRLPLTGASGAICKRLQIKSESACCSSSREVEFIFWQVDFCEVAGDRKCFD